MAWRPCWRSDEWTREQDWEFPKMWRCSIPSYQKGIFVHCYIFALRQKGFDSDPSKWLWIDLAEIQRFPHGNWAWHCACSVPKKNAGCCFAVGFITFRFLDAKYTKHYLFKTFLHLTILFKTGQCSVLVSLFSLSLSLALSLSLPPSLPPPPYLLE